MKSRKPETLVPQQEQGEASYAPSTVNMHSNEGALSLFNKAKERLLDINHWADLCSPLSAIFHITDASGIPVYSDAEEGNFIRIHIPGATNYEGQGFDWLKIEKIEQHPVSDLYSLFLLQVRPSHNPMRDHARETAHFPDQTATISFIIERDGPHVNASIYSRNETPNRSNARPSDPSTALFNKLQWKALAEGLLRDKSSL